MTLYRRSALAGFGLVASAVITFTLWSDWGERRRPYAPLELVWPWNTRP